MGFSIPAAIGAKVGRPDRTVWAVDGDGCFQMTAQELVTATVERIPIKVALLNNSYLGMVRQWQEMFYDERYSEVYLSPDCPTTSSGPRRWAASASASSRPRRSSRRSRRRTRSTTAPVVVEFRVDSDEKVFPMVPAGQAQRRPDPAPDPAGDRAERCVMSKEPLMTADEQRTRPNHHILSVLVQNRPGVLARVAEPVRPPRLQHLLARRRARRGRGHEPDHDRRRRRVGAARADHQAAVQADRRGQDHRARPAPLASSASCCSPRSRAPAEQRSQVVELVNIFEGKILAVARRGADAEPRGAPRQARRLRGAARRLWHRRAAAHRAGRAAQARPQAARCVPSISTRKEGRAEMAANVYYAEDADPSIIRGEEGGDHRLRLAGPRPRAQPEGLRRRRRASACATDRRRRPRPRRRARA